MIEDDFLSNFTGAAEQMGNGRKIMVVAVGEEPPSIKAPAHKVTQIREVSTNQF